MKRAAVGLLVIAALALPEVAHACAVCMGGQDEEVRTAFIVTTGLMTFLPLLMVGVFVWFLRRRLRQLRAQEDQSSMRGYVSRSPVPAPAKAPAAMRLAADQSPLNQ